MDSRTSHSLLLRMQGTDTREQAWEEFVSRYGEKILQWARGVVRCEEEAKDVAQTVLFSLWRAFAGGWQYEPGKSLRAWLRKVTRNAAIAGLRRDGRGRNTGGSANLELLNEIAVADSLIAIVEDEHEREILERAEAVVEAEVHATHWKVYKLRIEGHTLERIAADHKITYNNAKMILSRVKSRVEMEGRRLNGESLHGE